jgi:hypothetical protein
MRQIKHLFALLCLTVLTIQPAAAQRAQQFYWDGAAWQPYTGGPVPSTAPASAITPSISASAAATSLIVKNTPGNYYDGYCQSSAAGRCILYNSTTVPGAGALTPALVLECAIVPAGGSGSWAYGDLPRRASVGLVMLYSTGADCNTYTVSATAYIHASAM